MSLISESEKAEFKDAYRQVAETFEREVKVYLDGEIAVISTNPNFNPFFNNISVETGVSITPQVYSIPVRIFYEPEQQTSNMDVLVGGFKDEGQIKLPNSNGKARIKVNASGHNIIKDAKRIEIDDTLFSISSDPRPMGLFGYGYYMYYLSRSQ